MLCCNAKGAVRPIGVARERANGNDVQTRAFGPAPSDPRFRPLTVAVLCHPCLTRLSGLLVSA